MAIRTAHDAVDGLFRQWRDALGADWAPYRNHVYRVLNIAAETSGATGEQLEKLALAAAFHDVGIWLDSTFDYLEPSVRRAAHHLDALGRQAWAPEVTAIIRNHHKIRPWHGPDRSLVEALRRADWLDVSLFLLPGGVPASFRAALLEAFPRAGFHRRLVELGTGWARRHPLRPLPMLRW